MSTFPPTFLPQIDSAIQQGRGAAASVLGQTFDVRRLSTSTNVSISANPPVYNGFPARIQRTTNKKQIENATFDLLVFEFTCDARNLLIGDVLTSTGYGATPNDIFTFASARKTRQTLCMRTEFYAFVSRPFPLGGAGAAENQPMTGPIAVPDGTYIGETKASEKVLTLTNGLYSFTEVPGATPAQIAIGLQPTSRVRDAKEPPIPTALYREHFLAYIPLLPGEQISELDRLNFGSSDRYQIMSVYTSESTGLAGYLTICEKLSN